MNDQPPPSPPPADSTPPPADASPAIDLDALARAVERLWRRDLLVARERLRGIDDGP